MPTALITGGAGGMGLATAHTMGRDHRIVLADVNAERLDAAVTELGGAGIEAVAVTCDITNRTSVDALIETANSDGDLRAVVHTAGVSPRMGDAATIIRINALGTIHLTQAALAVATPGFAVVNVASFAGHTAPGLLVSNRRNRKALTDPAAFISRLTAVPNRLPASQRSNLAYGLSKQFVIWYSATMAAAFGAKGARILSVSPGSIDTSMGRLEIESGSEKILIAAALKRFGTAQEMADLLAFCASDKASYLTGVDILNDGGTKAGLTWQTMLRLDRGQ